jgi:hypothetical protein
MRATAGIWLQRLLSIGEKVNLISFQPTTTTFISTLSLTMLSAANLKTPKFGKQRQVLHQCTTIGRNMHTIAARDIYCYDCTLQL